MRVLPVKQMYPALFFSACCKGGCSGCAMIFTKQEATEISLDIVGKSLQFFFQTTGQIPGSLSELSAPKCQEEKCLMFEGTPKDAWGTELTFERDEKVISIRSAGPDTTFYTADDLVLSRTLVADAGNVWRSR